MSDDKKRNINPDEKAEPESVLDLQKLDDPDDVEAHEPPGNGGACISVLSTTG
jgi:hypothetical protein